MAEKSLCPLNLQEQDRNRDWLTALIPVFFIGFLYYGWWVPVLALTGAGTYLAVTVLTDRWGWWQSRVETALVTGLLVTFCLPATAPFWTVVLACALAAGLTVAVDRAGERWRWATAPVCPPLVGYLAVRWLFPSAVTGFALPSQWTPLDGVAGATPLAALWDGTPRETATRLFTGAHSSAIGEGCVAVLLMAAAYLLFRRRLRLIAPGVMLGTVSLLCWLLWDGPLYGLLAGGVVLAALVMADRAYAPASYVGQALTGLLAGGTVVLMRALTDTDGSAVGVLVGCVFGWVYPALAGLVLRLRSRKTEKFAKTENKG